MAEDEAARPSVDAIEGSLELTRQDFVSAVRHLPGMKRSWPLPVMLLVFMLLSSWFGAMPLTPSTLLPAAFVAAMTFYFQHLNRQAWIKRAFAELGGGVTDFRFDDFGFSVESSLRQHRLAWASLARFIETPGSFLVYTSPQTLLVVPKRAFEADEVDDIRELCAARIVYRPDPAGGGPWRGSLKRVGVLWVVVLVMFLATWHFLSTDAPPTSQPLPAQRISEDDDGGDDAADPEPDSDSSADGGDESESLKAR
jgi:hypothetical protein